MRYALLFVLASPAAAWEFLPEPICTLRHRTAEAELVITYDADVPLYTLSVTLNDGIWLDSPNFGIAYTGGVPITIGTGTHTIQGGTLSVQDSGFGNVLDGIALNKVATAFTDSLAVNFPLDGADQPLAAFRACPQDLAATS